MRNVMSSVAYVGRDVLGVLFAIQFPVLSLKGKAWFVSVGKIGRARYSPITAKSMRAKYFWAVASAVLFAGVLWDLTRKFPQ